MPSSLRAADLLRENMVEVAYESGRETTSHMETDQAQGVDSDSSEGHLLRVESVEKSFGRTSVLESVSLTIGHGEFFTLLGPSGCGKTTLLRIIAGFEHADAGRVILDGADLKNEPPERRPFNMVFQSYALFPHMTVRQNLAYGPRAQGTPPDEIRARCDTLLELIDLLHAADRSVSDLSGGQQQRVALARALVNEPKMLLLDEPLGALDLRLRKRLQEELRSIQRRLNTTFMYVTHDQEEAITMSDRIAVMDRGRLQQVGSPREIYDQPRNLFAAEFMGETNKLPVIVVESSDRVATVEFPGGRRASLPYFCSHDFTPGEAAWATVRPHHIVSCTEDESVFGATLDDTVYMGTYERHDFSIDGEHGISAALHLDTPVVGETYHLKVRPGNGVLVPVNGQDEEELESDQ